MKKLIDGYQDFRDKEFPGKRPFYEKLAEGQSPRYLMITCSDSRVMPQALTRAEVGDMFVDRCLGNIVPEPATGADETLSVIEYAVVALGVKHIIVCGHSHCGAMKGLLHPESLVGLPLVAHWLGHAQETLDRVRQKYPKLEGEALLEATVRENVLVMVERVKRLPFVAPRLGNGPDGLGVHAWVFEIEDGSILEYDPRKDRYVVLPQAYKPTTS